MQIHLELKRDVNSPPLSKWTIEEVSTDEANHLAMFINETIEKYCMSFVKDWERS